jgi:FkbM family methyltransferase
MRVLIFSYSARSYSQEGEDMILRRIFQERGTGFYVDVGAHHPRHFSNTYYFYQRGWFGVNIDATPGSMTPFRRMRPRDINVEAAIAKDGQKLTFFIFDGPALNTFDESLALSRERESGGHIIKRQQISTQTLEEVLDQHLPKGQAIQFLTVDVEGLDLEVLQSNNWQRYRPEYVLAECWELTLTHAADNILVQYMDSQGYDLMAKAVSTTFFRAR